MGSDSTYGPIQVIPPTLILGLPPHGTSPIKGARISIKSGVSQGWARSCAHAVRVKWGQTRLTRANSSYSSNSDTWASPSWHVFLATICPANPSTVKWQVKWGQTRLTGQFKSAALFRVGTKTCPPYPARRLDPVGSLKFKTGIFGGPFFMRQAENL